MGHFLVVLLFQHANNHNIQQKRFVGQSHTGMFWRGNRVTGLGIRGVGCVGGASKRIISLSGIFTYSFELNQSCFLPLSTLFTPLSAMLA